jgi:hypothetical protein
MICSFDAITAKAKGKLMLNRVPNVLEEQKSRIFPVLLSNTQILKSAKNLYAESKTRTG